ncbi:MAG: fibronectin type III domain-containing protein [candidate division Zixibacteria bacterium]|nr:fibronectin type III domain-containing protein [candidate division Zixibacteria bacterium]
MGLKQLRIFKYFSFIIFSLIIINSTFVIAQDGADSTALEVVDSLTLELQPQPATNITAKDTPNDEGGSIIVSWNLSADDYAGGKVTQYKVFRAMLTDGKVGEFEQVGENTAGAESFQDGNVDNDFQYVYKVQAINSFYDENAELKEFFSESKISKPVSSSPQWFKMYTINTLIGVVLLCFFIIFYINQASKGKKLFIRKLAGMEAVHEAVGRATEMGRKIFYVSGLGDMDNMQTIASMTILGRVSELAAEYDTYLDVPVCRSLVMVTAKEVVKGAYSKAGRPDSFQEDQVHYVTDDQFGYAAAVDGMFVREKPATIFFMGQFFAESLILAETGNSIGAIQIAGTAMPSQLPFFVAACDYTLIGEELFAASSYLSKEPKLLGSLKGQDIGKGVILVALIIGVILETFNIWNFSSLFSVID